MASLVLNGNTSGSITISSPAVSGTTTLTLPATTDTLVGKTTTDTLTNKTLTSPTITGASITVASTAAPAFSAYANSGTSLTNATWTKITFAAEEFDTNSNFASSRFTPTVAGYYQLNASWQSGSGTSFAGTAFYKNGSLYQYVAFIGATSVGTQAGGSVLIYFNGSTDYVEIYAYQATGGTVTVSSANSALSWFSGSMARSA